MAKGKNRSKMQMYVLGLLYFEDDTSEGVILSRKELASIGWMFASSVFGDSKPDITGDDTYFKFKLSALENSIAFNEFIGPNLVNAVEEIQFGYYHHRAIFTFTFKQETKLHILRNARHQLYDFIRVKCFDKFTDCEVGAPQFSQENNSVKKIKYIYSYIMSVIPNGKKTIDKEKKHMKSIKYDDIYTARSTTFGLHLPEFTSILHPRKHFVRISVPSTVIYVDGKTIRPDLFDNIIDAIYYGGLYQKVIIDRESAEKKGHNFRAIDTWTNDLLLKCLDVLNNSVSSNEVSDVSVQLKRLALITALSAIAISVAINLFI